MIDISSNGLRINIKSNGYTVSDISEFTDDGTPVEVPALEVVGSGMSLNGCLVTWTKPNPIGLSFTLIPRTVSDENMRNFLIASHVGGNSTGLDTDNLIIQTLTIKYPSTSSTTDAYTKMATYRNGRLVSGPVAIGSNADGKLTACTYTFVFESCTKV